MLDFSQAKPAPHYCQLPEIVVWDLTGYGAPRIAEQLPNGTRFTCDACGRVKIVTWSPGGSNGSVAWTGSWVWRDETWLERLKRKWR